MKLSVVIGVYDERETIAELTRRLISALDGMKDWRWELIYVIEGVDGSREIAEQLATGRPEIRVLYREKASGLGAAFRLGFAAVSADADLVVTMDADLNHQPEEIPRLVEAALRRQADIVVGSRFIAGGRAEGTPLWKVALSRALNAVMRPLFGVGVRDKTSGFRVYRAAVVRELDYRGDNFAFLPEILIAARRAGLRVTEEPIHFIYRRQGHSKMGLVSTTWSYLSLLGGREHTVGGSREAAAARPGWRPLLAVLAVVALFFLSLEVAHPYYFLQDDNRDYNLPLYVLAARTLTAGDLAQFNFHQSLGTPLLATGQPAILSPLPYLAVALSDWTLGQPDGAIEFLVVVYFLAGSLGMLALARELRLSAPAAVLSALTWPLLPLNVYFSVSWGTVAPLVGLLPWTAASCIRLASGRGRLSAALTFAGAHTLLFLAGYPPWTAYALAIELPLFACFAAACGRPRRACGWMALAGVFTVLFSLPLLAPMAAQTAQSQMRGESLGYVRFASEALRPTTWLNGVVWPFARWLRASNAHFYSEVGAPAALAHLGYPVLALLAVALATMPRERNAWRRIAAWGCAVLALVTLAWAFGWLSPAVFRLPIFNRFRWPVRLLFFSELLLLLLAAIGFDALRDRLAPRRAAVLTACVLVLQVGNLWLANLLHRHRGFVVHSDPVPLTEPWRERLARGRIVSLGHYALGGRVDTLRSVGFNYPSLWGLFHMGGYDPLTSQASYQATHGFSHSSSFADPPAKLEVPFLRSWGVRWYVASPGAVRAYSEWLGSHGVKPVECEDARCLFEDPAAPPLAAWADSGTGEGLELRVDGASLTVAMDRSKGGDVVLAFLEHPFLQASIDSAAVPIRRLPGGQMLVTVPAGRHLLRLRYDDPLFRLGCYGAGAGLALAAITAFFETRARRKQRAAQAGPAT